MFAAIAVTYTSTPKSKLLRYFKGYRPGNGSIVQNSNIPSTNKLSADEVENNLLSPETLATKTEAARASLAASKSRQKASKAADQTASAAKSVTDTKAATKAALAEVERGRHHSALGRAAASADKEAKAAKKAALEAEQMAMRAVKLASDSEVVAAEAREMEMVAIKAGAKAKGAEIELVQAERGSNPSSEAIRSAKRLFAKLAEEAEAQEAASGAIAMKVTALATEAKGEAMAAAKKVGEAALAVKRTELATWT